MSSPPAVFVDSPLRCDPEDVLLRFAQMPSGGGDRALRAFVQAHFDKPGSDLTFWSPPDFVDEPAALAALRDPDLRQWALELNRFWAQLGRATSGDAEKTPQRRTLLSLPHPFVVPGGRFVETYYWDSYWILKGLLTCGMRDTARGMVLNLLHQVDRFGFVPNGARLYYLNRSQPPVLAEMVLAYLEVDFDLELLRRALPTLLDEYAPWMHMPHAARHTPTCPHVHMPTRPHVYMPACPRVHTLTCAGTRFGCGGGQRATPSSSPSPRAPPPSSTVTSRAPSARGQRRTAKTSPRPLRSTEIVAGRSMPKSRPPPSPGGTFRAGGWRTARRSPRHTPRRSFQVRRLACGMACEGSHAAWRVKARMRHGV